MHAVVLRPLPVPDPTRIVAVYEFFRNTNGSMSAGNYVDAVAQSTSFSHTTAILYSSFNLGDSADAERIIGARTTAGFFGVFGTPPALGRVYSVEEDQPGREQVVVLSHRLWTRRFGSDRQDRRPADPHERTAVRSHRRHAGVVRLHGSDRRIVGADRVDRGAQGDSTTSTPFVIYARLKPGVPLGQARSELARFAVDLRKRFPKDDAELSFAVAPLMEELVGDYRQRLFILLGAVGFVLLIACGNIANLLLARGAARAGEMAIRAALGAGRGRMVRQLLTESLVLALISAAAGLALAAWGIRALIAAAPDGVPRLEQTTLDPVVVGFTLLIALTSAVLFGLAPAMRAARSDVQTVLKEGGRGAAMGGRARPAAHRPDRRRAGRRARAARRRGPAHPQLHGAPARPARIRSARRDERAAVAARGRIRGAGARRADVRADRGSRSTDPTASRERRSRRRSRWGPAATGTASCRKEGRSNQATPILSRLRIVTPGYIETMRIPILKGRAIQDSDRRGALKVMVISEALADAAFPGDNPIGKRIACCEAAPDGKSPDYKTVVGVAGDVLSRGLGEPPAPEFYLPAAQVPDAAWDWIQRTMYVRDSDVAGSGRGAGAAADGRRRHRPGRSAVQRPDDGGAAA